MVVPYYHTIFHVKLQKKREQRRKTTIPSGTVIGPAMSNISPFELTIELLCTDVASPTNISDLEARRQRPHILVTLAHNFATRYHTYHHNIQTHLYHERVESQLEKRGQS